MLTRKSYDYDENISFRLKELQEEAHIRIMAAGFPVSYYEALFGGMEKPQDDLLREYGADQFNVPVSAAFVSVWYADLKNTGDAFKNGTEHWKHVPCVKEAGDGIYIINQNAGGVSEFVEDVLPPPAQAGAEPGKILLTFQNQGEGDYAVIVDGKKLGIPEGAEASVTCSGTETVCESRHYTELSALDRGFMMEGENLRIFQVHMEAGDTLAVTWE